MCPLKSTRVRTASVADISRAERKEGGVPTTPKCNSSCDKRSLHRAPFLFPPRATSNAFVRSCLREAINYHGPPRRPRQFLPLAKGREKKIRVTETRAKKCVTNPSAIDIDRTNRLKSNHAYDVLKKDVRERGHYLIDVALRFIIKYASHVSHAINIVQFIRFFTGRYQVDRLFRNFNDKTESN